MWSNTSMAIKTAWIAAKNVFKPGMYKKGTGLASLPVIALTFAVGIMILSITSDIVSNINSNQASGSAARNVSGQGLLGMKQIGIYFPTMGLVLAAAIVMTVLLGAFAFGKQK